MHSDGGEGIGFGAEFAGANVSGALSIGSADACLVLHNCFRSPSLLVEGLLSSSLPRLFLLLGRDGATITYFSSIQVLRTSPVLYKKTPPEMFYNIYI